MLNCQFKTAYYKITSKAQDFNTELYKYEKEFRYVQYLFQGKGIFSYQIILVNSEQTTN